jgi:hypothetical protein
VRVPVVRFLVAIIFEAIQGLVQIDDFVVMGSAGDDRYFQLAPFLNYLLKPGYYFGLQADRGLLLSFKVAILSSSVFILAS